ncbi:MAG: hypothetical protein IJY89_01375 [Clostridia bacterium]|nr:hypothetical protein [Clostridia bacterium]MBQ8911204.1 hypothetical protein [Clostridia bacterium]
MAKKCIYCGMILEGTPDVCPICGTPVGAKGEELSPVMALNAENRRKKRILFFAILLTAALLAACALYLPGLLAPEEVPPTPEERWKNHLLLEERSAGVCQSLLGRAELFFVFVEDLYSDWTPEEKASATERLNAEADALEKEALKFGVTLEVRPYFTNLQLMGTADHHGEDSWQAQYAKEQGYDSLAAMQRERGSLSEELSAPVVFLFDYPGRSYAFSGGTYETPEYAVLFAVEDFRHELFHLYGAEDYYFHTLIESSARLHLSESIMNDGTVTDDLTAYAIGWKDTLTEDAASFLEATSELTRKELESARAKDQVTGTDTITYDNGDVYTGELVDGVPQGQGTYTFADGSVYEGSFEVGYFHGYGKYTDVTYGYTYEGGFQFDLFHGQGVLISDDGTKYTGEFKNDQCHGKGTYTYADGSTYVGDFAEGYFHGIGEYYDAESGSRYKGEFENDLFNGKGTLTFGDGDVYVGTFKDDLFDGQGTYTFADGRVYEGQFKRDEFHGQGTMTYPDGTVESGTWFDGEFVG